MTCNKPNHGNKTQHVKALSEKTATPYKISTDHQRPQPPTKTRETTWHMYFTSMTPVTAAPGYWIKCIHSHNPETRTDNPQSKNLEYTRSPTHMARFTLTKRVATYPLQFSNISETVK
jgi:hypothetical protein